MATVPIVVTSLLNGMTRSRELTTCTERMYLIRNGRKITKEIFKNQSSSPHGNNSELTIT
ncbi:hypothetical protein DERF_000870 [Dermatophagoides farinae]|uniref:Uncharacterized protein n=1 Tax=Dermatophagoides farinae TaxID=6954 RepID=A0A922L930_DERFA|nr:hypothetical protein DERF_000870 [Dermatophagoides farinae]